MKLFKLDLGQTYNITLKAVALLGTGYDSALITGIMMYNDAVKFQGDLNATHAAVYPLLGVGIPRDARDLTYVRIKTSSGDYRIIAQEWIATQPVLVSSQTVRLIIHGVSSSDMSVLRDLLIRSGFNSFDLSVIANS
jgi:hypothetical protein